MMDLIFVSLENWDEVWRRNQFLCAGLARRYPEMRILFVGLPKDVSHGVRRGDFRALRDEATYQVPDYPNITVTHPWKLAPNTLHAGRAFNEWLMRKQVKRVAQRQGIREPVLWLNPHSAVHMAGRMGERAVLYDITDDWISLTQADWLARLTAVQDRELCRRADAVIVCSEKLFELKRGLARDLHLVPNGVDAAHYASVGTPGPIPAEARHWQKPVLGYTGTVHPDRVDVDLVEAVASTLGQGSVVMIGPNHLEPSQRARLERRGNVFFKEAVPYRQLPGYMRAFDISITPHRVTPFTESLNPIKLWEYLAAGKPIISTPVAGFRDYPQHVYLAADADGFSRATRLALREGSAPQEARREEARKHSWKARLDAVEAVLRGCISRDVERGSHAG